MFLKILFWIQEEQSVIVFCCRSTHDAIAETWGKISWVMNFEGVNYFLNLFIRFGIITMEVETQEKFGNIFLEKACKLLQD